MVFVESEIFVVITRAAAAVLQMLDFGDIYVYRPMFFKFCIFMTCLHASIPFKYYQDILKGKKLNWFLCTKFSKFSCEI
jgi:hypothetical protein